MCDQCQHFQKELEELRNEFKEFQTDSREYEQELGKENEELSAENRKMKQELIIFKVYFYLHFPFILNCLIFRKEKVLPKPDMIKKWPG
jgi:hypothetical protein